MSISSDELEKIAKLAYLDTKHSDKLAEEIASIMEFVETLRSIDTKKLAPLFHPLDLHQPLRKDIASEENCLLELMAIAPMVDNNYYLVPKVIEKD